MTSVALDKIVPLDTNYVQNVGYPTGGSSKAVEEVEEFEEVEAKPSLRETLEANFSKLEEGEEAGEFEDEAEGAEESSAPSSRSRDASGRFAKPDHEVHTSGEDTATEGVEPQAIDPALSYSAPALAPPGWTAEEGKAFNQAPPELRAAIHRRETDLRRGLSQATEEAKQVRQTWQEVEQAIAPYAQQFQRAGVTPGRVVNQLMAWQQFLDNDTDRALLQLAQSYGRSFQDLVQKEAAQPQEPPAIRELRQQNQQLMGLYQQQRQAQVKQAQARLASEIDSFVKEVDASGSPARPHIEHVVNDMLPIVQSMANSGLAPRQILQQAYEKALWLNPATRELEMKRLTPRPTKESIDKARRAQKLINGEARGVVAPERPKSVRAALLANAEKLNL